MALEIITLRSRVGTYHKGYNQGGAFCNGRMSVRAANASEASQASAYMFCEKCFPNGKPTE